MLLSQAIGAVILAAILVAYIIFSGRSIGYSQTFIGLGVAVVVTALIVVALSFLVMSPF